MSYKLNKKPMSLAIAYGVLAIISGKVCASGIEEVTVTAEKREVNLQSTPIAITALSAEALQNLGVSSFDSLAKVTPSMSFTPYPSSSNLLILYMRGQGVSDPMQITSDGSVGLYSDGFYISRPQAATADIADIERIEVLRGPQGTLYGRNTTGGAVNLISKKPTGEFGLSQDLSYGTLNAFRSLTTINLPKWNDLSTKFTLLKTSKDGYVKNDGSGHDYGEQDQHAGRFSLRWEPASNFITDYFMEKGSFDSTPGYYQNKALNGGSICTPINSPACYGAAPTNPFYAYGSPSGGVSRTYRPIDLNLSTSSFESHGLTLSWDLSDDLTIKSLTGYRKIDWHAYQDYAEAFSTSAAFPVGFTSNDLVRSHQFTQEFQFIGSALDDQIHYVSGLYYFQEGASHAEQISILLPYYAGIPGVVIPGGPGLTTDTFKNREATADSKSQAAYAQVTWSATDKLDLMVGGRYTKDDRSATRNYLIDYTNDALSTTIPEQSIKSASQSYQRFNPAVKLAYQITEDANGYLSVTTGYKAGGFSESSPTKSLTSNVDNFEQGFKPEKVTTYELGFKSYWFERRVRANMAIYSSKFEDLQMGFTVDPGDASVLQSYNAGKATINGAEIEVLVQPTDDFAFSIDYAYLDPRLDSIKALAGTTFDPAVNSASPYKVGDSIKGALSFPTAPKNSVNMGADYTFLHFDKGSLAAHLNYQYQSSSYNGTAVGSDVPGKDYYELPGFGVVDARFTLAIDLPRGDHAKISLWGKNIANKEHPIQVIANGNNIATPSAPAGYTSTAAIWAEPASYGVDFHYEY